MISKHRPSSRIIPGFNLTLGFSLTYLSLLILVPLSMLILKTSSMSLSQIGSILTSPRVAASFFLSFSLSAAAAFINIIFGILTAWVLVRYEFRFKKVINAFIDLPFALPTAVAGISLTSLYSQNGWVGQYLDRLGIKASFTPLGIMIALIFIGLPFVVRSVEPILEDLDKEIEEAAFSLGANRWQVFRKIIFPLIFPAALAGAGMAFARALGEYGSVVFISGNMPFKTEVIPLLIMTKLEQYDYQGATVIALATLLISFLLLFFINAWQCRLQRFLD